MSTIRIRNKNLKVCSIEGYEDPVKDPSGCSMLIYMLSGRTVVVSFTTQEDADNAESLLYQVLNGS